MNTSSSSLGRPAQEGCCQYRTLVLLGSSPPPPPPLSPPLVPSIKINIDLVMMCLDQETWLKDPESLPFHRVNVKFWRKRRTSYNPSTNRCRCGSTGWRLTAAKFTRCQNVRVAYSQRFHSLPRAELTLSIDPSREKKDVRQRRRHVTVNLSVGTCCILANFWKVEVGTHEMWSDLDYGREAIIARAKPSLF